MAWNKWICNRLVSKGTFWFHAGCHFLIEAGKFTVSVFLEGNVLIKSLGVNWLLLSVQWLVWEQNWWMAVLSQSTKWMPAVLEHVCSQHNILSESSSLSKQCRLLSHCQELHNVRSIDIFSSFLNVWFAEMAILYKWPMARLDLAGLVWGITLCIQLCMTWSMHDLVFIESKAGCLSWPSVELNSKCAAKWVQCNIHWCSSWRQLHRCHWTAAGF